VATAPGLGGELNRSGGSLFKGRAAWETWQQKKTSRARIPSAEQSPAFSRVKVGDEADGGVPPVGDGRKKGRAVSETEGNDAA